MLFSDLKFLPAMNSVAATAPGHTYASSPISSPRSPTQFKHPILSTNHTGDHSNSTLQRFGVHDAHHVGVSTGQAAPNSVPSVNGSEPAPKPKRKKATPKAQKDGNSSAEPKEKKQRKPRDPNKPPAKKRKTAETPIAASALDHTEHAPSSMASAPHEAKVVASSTSAAQSPAQIGNNEAKGVALPSASNGGDQNPRASSSGQRYDPICGAASTGAAYASAKTNAADTNATSATKAVRSPPSIANLLSPSPSSAEPPSLASRVHSTSNGSTITPQQRKSQSALKPSPKTLHTNDAMDIDEKLANNTTVKARKSDSPKSRPSPKPARTKEAAPPPPVGSGLLSNAAFGRPDDKPKQYAEVPNQCIVIEVPMNKGGGGYVNFLKEVEQKYGFDVAHPRLAEHKRRMNEIAAAGAAIESGPGSADEMIVDGSDAESNAEMGAMEDGSAPEGEKKKRRPKKDEYNKDDDFIDDTEMCWEEQALASKDGYFVWSGPLVPEGDKPTVERADGTVKRGRGTRGRGGVTRGETSGRGRGTGGGRGSRGGATVRKPRVTKADRARMDAEKMERERMGAMTAAPSQYPGTS